MTEEEHKQRHLDLHRALDELAADWIAQTKSLPSKATVLDLMRWSHAQTAEPAKAEHTPGVVIISKGEPMKDTDKVLVLLHLVSRGLPPGSEGEKMVNLFAAICDWPLERARAAINYCVARGFVDYFNSASSPESFSA